MWGTIAGSILKAVPWEAVFSIILKAILTNEQARKNFYNFIYKIDDSVPVRKQDEYNELKLRLIERIKKENDLKPN